MKEKLNEINEKFESVVELNCEEVKCVTGGNNTSGSRLTVAASSTTTAPAQPAPQS